MFGVIILVSLVIINNTQRLTLTTDQNICIDISIEDNNSKLIFGRIFYSDIILNDNIYLNNKPSC